MKERWRVTVAEREADRCTDRLDNASSTFQQPLPVVGLDKSIMIHNTVPYLILIGDLAVHMILVLITFILDQRLCNRMLTLVDATVDVFVIVGSCHSSSIFLGHDLCVRTFRKLCGLRWIRQHLFYLQPENPWGECTCKPWACWAYRWALLLLRKARPLNRLAVSFKAFLSVRLGCGTKVAPFFM